MIIERGIFAGMAQAKFVVMVVGPTAVGKTAWSIRLAQHYGTEIISADSRQFFREMEIGTAKPDAEERAAAPHHLVDSLSIHDFYHAMQFEQDALALIEQLHRKHEVVLVTGGSGLYVKALCEGMDEMPAVTEGVRDTLNAAFAAEGLEPLLAELQEKDPVYYAEVDRQNHQRVIRALEVIRSCGRPFSDFRVKREVERPFIPIKIGLRLPREELYARIDERMDQMIAAGLFEEAERLYPHRALNALQTVGYTEIFGYLDGDYDREEAVRLLKRNSRRYAKRQLTWFQRDEDIRWFERPSLEELCAFIDEKR